MDSRREAEVQGHLAVLEEAIERCKAILAQKKVQEADLRDGLCLLKLAHSDAEYGLVGLEREDWQRLRANTIVVVAELLRPLRGFNPDLNTWERARDPTILVQGKDTRSGARRAFDYPRIKGVYEEIKRRIWSKIDLSEVPADDQVGSARTDNRAGPSREAGAGPSLPRVEPPPALQAARANSDPSPAQPGSGHQNRPARKREETRAMSARGVQPDALPGYGGPLAGRFVMATTDGDSSSWTDVTRDEHRRKERRQRNRKDKKYGHKEDDLDFFRGAFKDEASALQRLDLGDDFKYPSDEAFARYFPEFDFVKAMRGNGLRKWDGSIRDYPGFKHNYYRMVYVQREHYMHKVLALEQMVPEHIKKELFHGLQYTVEDLGQRLQRLEDRFGGQEKQTKQIVSDLQKLQQRGRIPYPELRAAVEDVGAYLDRPSTLPGTGETLVVLLKKVIPKHFKTQYNDAMHQWGQPRTGNNFVAYMKRKLTYEIDESEETDKKEITTTKRAEDNREKKSGSKVLGKLYHAQGIRESEVEDIPSDGSNDEGECFVVGNKVREIPTCKCCGVGKHYLHNCRKFFLIFALKDRVSYAKQEQICFKCLRLDHKLNNCPFQAKPDCRFCGGADHHYLLCPGPAEGAAQLVTGEDEAEEATGMGFENIGELIARKNVSTLQLVANLETADGRLVPINILPDTGSSHNILDKKVAVKAGMTGFQCKYRVTAHGGHVTEHEAICGEVVLTNPKRPEEKHRVRVYAYENPCGPFFPVDWGKMKGSWPHLKGLDIPSPAADKPIEMILGCENIKLFEPIKPATVRGDTDPVARLTCLGWMIGGRTHPEPNAEVSGESRVIMGDVGIASGRPGTQVSLDLDVGRGKVINPRSLLSSCRLVVPHDPAECQREYEQLKHNLKRVWELESAQEVGKMMNNYYPAVQSIRQKKAEATIMEHLLQLNNGQYQTKLLWSTDRRPRNNYVEAKRAFENWERRLEEDEEMRRLFHTSISNWIISDYVENTVNDPDGQQNFLTTFMVFKEDEVPRKGRLVVNGAKKFKNECLNDFLEPGSNVMNDLTELLMRVRRHKYVVCCDLANMFLNIRVAPEDRPYLRMFYREKPSDELKVYQFAVHAFGLASSPCVAMSIVKAHAKKHGPKWPIAEKAVRLNSLVDDIWLMSDNRADVEEGMKQIVELMREMGIAVHKWGSNCPELLEEIPKERRAKQIKLSDSEDTAIKALGLTWDTESDTFLFTKGPPLMNTWTLRTMTSSAGRLFDPLVLLGPATLPAKLLIQLAWRYQSDWDEELPDCLGKKMTLYCKNQFKLDQIQIKRHLGGDKGQGKLVIFTDSSTLAQAAAAYWISEGVEGLDANLLASKSKITGLRQHEHIGRLELIAAVMGVGLALKVALAYGLSMDDVTYFTDSMSVLYWLSTTATLSAYTGHRVAKICERSHTRQWNYVNTKENPSDLPTRGMRAEDLVNCELWWKGPPFLRKPRWEWPEQPQIRSTESAAAEIRAPEDIARSIVMLQVGTNSETGPVTLIKKLLEKGTSVREAMNSLTIMAGLFRAKFRNPKFNLTHLKVENDWIRYEQKEKFDKLYGELKSLKRVSSLLELDPRLDQQEVIRVSRGLKHSLHHNWEAIFPILLHGDMRYAQELIKYTHEKALKHMGGVNTVMELLRNRFHVVGGKRSVKDMIHRCFPCAKKSWRPLERKLPEFHQSRLSNKDLVAFNEIGIDHAGPFQLRQGRGSVQGYILVIACCATRAVNLEMSLSTGADHVLAALQRHIGVFGPPAYINSDQGAGFIKARRLIEEHAHQFTTEGWDHVGKPQWEINIPYSPTWSSHVEAMVKITKEALKHLHSGPFMTKMTPDEFYTQLKRVQGYINMRPLLQSSSDHLPLTPGDFIGTGNSWLTSFIYCSENRAASGHRLEQMNNIRKNVWKRFKDEYLTLLRRQKGRNVHLPEIGDLVLVSDVPSWKSDGWPVGRIVDIHHTSEEPRVYEIEIVPTEELKREPQMINNKARLKLKKKTIMRNYRKLGVLPKLTLNDEA